MAAQEGPPPTLYLLDYLDRRPLPTELREVCRQLLPLVIRETGTTSSAELGALGNRAEEIDRALLQLRTAGGTARWLIDRLNAGTGEDALQDGSRADQTRGQRQVVDGDFNVNLQVGESVQGGIHLGALPRPETREVSKAPPPPAAASEPAATEPPVRPTQRAPQPAPLPRPELEIVVAETTEGGRRCLNFEVTASDPAWALDHRSFGPVTLCCDPEAYAEQLLQRIEKKPLSGSREADLRDLGADLGRQLLGAELCGLLWSLQHRATTLSIGASPPWIPWELIHLSGPASAGRFLCEAFALSRWPAAVSPALELPLRRLALVCPAGGAAISAQEEMAFLLGLQSSARSVCPVEARYEVVVEAMASGGYDGWQFIGHGRAASGDANLAVIGLDGYRALTPKVLTGEASGLGRSRPFIFLNGCHTGRSGMALTEVGGWAPQFLAAGAGAFLGAQWSIDGRSSAAFSRAFYSSFLHGAPIAHAVREARRAVYSPGDSTWLAYALYAHPLASSRAWGEA